MQKSTHRDEIFKQKSYYYFADVTKLVNEQKLADYERELGFELIWEDIESAYNMNIKFANNYKSSFIIRESYVLKYLLDYPKNIDDMKKDRKFLNLLSFYF